ncbi:NAD-dependent epimerase/dehydratase family protein [Chitinophaga pendula]|uniref:NAD-dependent epimerase/dehydratase family protein n=1 Tax=Chitinophaga TaxID=79328 RepID=UPI000BAF66C3|nr:MULTISPECIES: NAD-dependent epimerase/dehydratase family protein [Chitinophaga]ASZ10302.1 3-beta hydroxysteroid dehydrogenase [Chitinophaga sp. MD30]UCJ06736.1 NAD-dependent epimerase/dehydratase family protein [Chitinophaga pendula]
MILVTGGTGFLGSHLLRSLVHAGKPVRALYRREIPHQLQDVREKIEWIQGDILDVVHLEAAMQGISQVYHSAAAVSFRPDDRAQMMRINIEGTANIVNLAIDAGVRKLVHVSSVSSIGRAKVGHLIDEDCDWVESPNNTAYAVSKYHSEMEVWRGIAEGLDAVIVNPSIILGSGFWHDGSGMLFKNAWKEFPYYTEGINGFVDVEDVVAAMIALMDSDITEQRFILSGDNWSYLDLFSEMARHMGKKPPHIAVKPWMAALVWRYEKVKGWFTGKKPLITRETAHTAQLKIHYSSQRVMDALPGFQFRPLQQTIERISRDFLKDQPLAAK